MLERKGRLLNAISAHKRFGPKAIGIMLRTETNIHIEEIPAFCFELGMKRAKILLIGIAYAQSVDDIHQFGRAFRICFSGMSFDELLNLFRAHIKKEKTLHAVIKGAREACAA